MIRLQFVLAKDWSSRLIAWYGQGYDGFSHVDAIMPDGWLLGARSDAIGGAPPGVWCRPPNYDQWSRREVVEIPCSGGQASGWEAWLRAQIDKPYDPDAIWGFITGRPAHARGHWICSACQKGALRHVRLLHGGPVPDSQTTPDALYQLVTDGIGGKAVKAA